LPLKNILRLSSVLETGTGIALILLPSLVVRLLLGLNGLAVENALGRFLGIGLLALGLACWPDQPANLGAPAFRAMVVYNLFVAILLAYLGAVGHYFGLLLWPAVVLHAAIAVLLLRGRRKPENHADATQQ
jgi:hypothetical protein